VKEEQQFSDLPALSIRRPLLVVVINLLIILAGLAALFAVDVRELPDVDRPVVSVRATFPGASPETMDTEVTSILEGAAARVSGVRTISSSSEENTGRVSVEFMPGTDLDTAASDVREAVSRVTQELPDDIEQLVVTKADEDSDPIITLAVWSDSLNGMELTRVVEERVIPEFVSIPGVATVDLFGEQQEQLHIVMDPLKLASHGLAVSDVADTLRTAPFDVPAGSFRSQSQDLLVRADATVITAEQVGSLIISGNTRVRDVANVYFGPADAGSYVRLNGRPVVGLGIVRQARSNTINISDGVREQVERVNARMDDLTVEITSDEAVFIRGAVTEVVATLAIAIGIVVLTIWLFLGSLRATLVPSSAIPIALIGTVAVIWALGFSINILTLLALVLGTGLIVDDAIVVLENIQRRRAQGLGARAAAVLGTRQVFFAVVTTTAVLVAVFVPISLLPGTAGRLFREFGVVLACSVAISGFVALSLIPPLAVRIIRGPTQTAFPGPVAAFGRRLAAGYDTLLASALRHPVMVIALALISAAGAMGLYTLVTQELVPDEDRGRIYLRADGPDGANLEFANRQAYKIEEVLQPYVEDGTITSLFTIAGRWDPHRAQVTATLAPWEDREISQQELVRDIEAKLDNIAGAPMRAYGSNSLSIGGGGDTIQVALLGNDYGEIFEAARTIVDRIETGNPNLSSPEISYQPTQPQLSIEIDRQRAADLGIPLVNISDTLRAMVDGHDIGDLNVGDNAIPILLEARNSSIRDPSALTNLNVRTAGGALVPLSSIIRLKEEGVATQLDRYEQSRGIEVEAQLADGYPLESAMRDLQELADEVLPADIDMIFRGEAETLQETSRDVTMTYVFALVVVLLVLVAQFENLTSAMVIIATVPFGVAAAIYALFLTGTSINIYSQIGLVMLIGLMAKNGILLVEFADQLRDSGMAVREAVVTAARVRLRPITMTMLCTILGGLPLILTSGPGAEARAAIGWVIFGGLGLAAVFTLFLAPVLYLGLAGFSKARAEESARLAREMQAAEAIPDRDTQAAE